MRKNARAKLSKITFFVLTLCTVSFGTPVFAITIDPVTAGIASGLAVELLKGIASSVKGDDVAQVQVRAKTDGPDGDDKAFDGETDKDNLWFEYYIDAEAHAEAAQVEHHVAWGELHYEYTGGKGWRPNNTAYVTGKEWWGVAIAYPDSTPEKGSDNKTEAAVVGAFAWNGVIEFKGYVDADRNIVEVPNSDKVQATNAVLLNFDYSQFSLIDDETDPTKVVVKPVDSTMSTVDLFHNYAGYATNLFFNPGLKGLNSLSDPLVSDIETDLASQAGLSVASPGQQAELTFGSASVLFDEKLIDRYKVVGSDLVEKTRDELLLEYFDNLLIGPTSNSQLGYAPTIHDRTTLFLGSEIPLTGLEADLADRLPSSFSGDIGLFFFVDSFLEDAINLAVDTTGSPLYDYFSPLNPGDTFTLDLSFGTGEVFIYSDQNTVPEPTTLALLLSGLLGIGVNGLTKRYRPTL